MKIPLCSLSQYSDLSMLFLLSGQCTDHAAPTTERPMQRAIPVLAHAWGEMLRRKSPTCKTCQTWNTERSVLCEKHTLKASPSPLKSMSKAPY